MKVMALVAPPTEASGCETGRRVGRTLARTSPSTRSTLPISFQRSLAFFAAAISAGVMPVIPVRSTSAMLKDCPISRLARMTTLPAASIPSTSPVGSASA